VPLSEIARARQATTSAGEGGRRRMCEQRLERASEGQTGPRRLSQHRVALPGDTEPANAGARAEPRARNPCRTRSAANPTAVDGGSDRRAVLQDDAGILRVTERADVAATSAHRDAPSRRAAIQEERHVGRRPVQVAARRAGSQRLPVVVRQETGHAVRSPAAVDVARGALEVERAGGASRGPSESLRREHCRKGEREDDSDRARRHENGRYNGGASARFFRGRSDGDKPGPSVA